MIVQFATVQLWSAITGTRPGVLLPQDTSSPGTPALGKRKRDDTFQSDLPKHITLKDLPDSVCYRDIELLYLKDPQSKRDVLCAIIEFRNLKGRPEGADGTKFFMHSDYQLAYCPIAQIIAFAFRDGSFANTDLTPELIWRLRVPRGSPFLPLRWKPEVLNVPFLRRLERTPYGYGLDGSLPMTYDLSRQALKELGRDARFEDDTGHYNFRRWTANEVNKNFISQERQRVLGQSGDAVFENHYQSQFIARDLQHVVLLRPSQDGLVRFAGSMLRKRDLSAPSDLTEAHKRAIFQNPGILQLRREKRELMAEMRSVAGTIKNARDTFPHLFQRHETVKKDLGKLRKTSAIETRETARKDYFNNAPVLEVDRQIKQMLLGESDVEERDADSSAEEDWELPIPDSHLLHAHDGISCNWEACRTLPKFAKITEFLAYANKEHKYDIKIKLCHLTERPRVSHGDGSSRETSMELVGRQGTENPASSVDFDMTNIDPRLMRPGPITVVKPSACPSKTDISASSSGCPVTTTDSNRRRFSARRVTRGTAKAANIEPGPKLESSSQHATRSSRKIRRPEEQPGGQQKGKGRPGKSKASSIRYMPRRSKRLRAQSFVALRMILLVRIFGCSSID